MMGAVPEIQLLLRNFSSTRVWDTVCSVVVINGSISRYWWSSVTSVEMLDKRATRKALPAISQGAKKQELRPLVVLLSVICQATLLFASGCTQCLSLRTRRWNTAYYATARHVTVIKGKSF